MFRLKTQGAIRKGTMQKKLIFLLTFFITNLAFSLEKTSEISFEKIPYKKSVKQSILAGDVFSESNVNSFTENNQKMQSLNFSIAGLHKKNCNYALKTLSNYEDFSKYIDFIKVSKYNEQTQQLDFILSHLLLPYDMRLMFKLPRVNKIGTYPFMFEIGILNGLKGNIHVMEYQNRCLFYSTANWRGPDTGFSNLIFELFSQALSKISMEVLFRISSTLSH